MWKFLYLIVFTTLLVACGGSANETISLKEGKNQQAEAQIQQANSENTIVSVTPEPNTTGVDRDELITILFSKPVDAEVVKDGGIRLYNRTQGMHVDLDFQIGTQSKWFNLLTEEWPAFGEEYEIQVSNQILGNTGEPSNIGFSSLFSVVEVADFNIVEATPSNDSVGHPRDSDIQLVFSTELIDETISSYNIALYKSRDDSLVPTDIKSDFDTVTIDPLVRLDRGAKYVLKLNTVITDVYHRALGTEQSVSFTTSSDFSVPIPLVSSTDLAGGTISRYTEEIYMEFSDELDSTSIDENDNFLQNRYTGEWIPTTASVEGRRLIIKPIAPLRISTGYSYGVFGAANSKVQNLNGDVVTSTHVTHFTTHSLSELDLSVVQDDFRVEFSTNHYFSLNKKTKTVFKADLSENVIVDTIQFDNSPINLLLNEDTGSLFVIHYISTPSTRPNTAYDVEFFISEYSSHDLTLISTTQLDLGYQSLESLELDTSESKFYSYSGYYSTTHSYTFTLNDPVLTRSEYPTEDQKANFRKSGHFRELGRSYFVAPDGSFSIREDRIKRNIAPTSTYVADSDILAVDFVNMVYATSTYLYSLETNEAIGPVPLTRVSSMFFDAEGNLFIDRVTSHDLYKLPRETITPEGLAAL